MMFLMYPLNVRCITRIYALIYTYAQSCHRSVVTQLLTIAYEGFALLSVRAFASYSVPYDVINTLLRHMAEA